MRITTCTSSYHSAMQSTDTRGAILRDLRKRKGVSQTELAHAIGIKTQGTISAWENDKQEIDPAHLLQLARYLSVDPETLGYVVPRTLDGDEVRAWLTEALDAAEARAVRRHEETLQAIDALGIAIRARRAR